MGSGQSRSALRPKLESGTGSKSSSIGTLTFTKSNFEPNEGLLGEEEPEFFVFKYPFQRQRETFVDELLVFKFSD